jgi:hypothetical protein
MRIQTRRQQIQELQGENQQQKARIQELVVAQDNILTLTTQANKKYTGNRYNTYETAVPALALAYSGGSDWGGLQAGNIVDLRAAYIVGQGIKISKNATADAKGKAPDADREYAFAQRFIKANKLDHELPQDLAREGELEGKTLIKLFPREEKENGFEGMDIILRWVSWTTNKYMVEVDKEDYLKLDKVTWTPSGGSLASLTPEECVYARFAGRLDIPNETMPRAAKCLTQIEDLDMALWDWRRINNLFAAPVLHIQCDTPEQAQKMAAAIESVNFLIGKAFAHTGVLNYAQPSAEGQKAIESEILTKMKLISGTTGVPINALGAPELTTKMGADSQAQLDLIAMSTMKEREVWRGTYQELIEKAMRMWNLTTRKTPLRPELIKVELPVVTEAQWERIVSTWLPVRTAKEITQKTFLSQIPGIDAEAEIEALDEEDAENMEKFSDAQDDDADPNADPNEDQNADEQGSGKVPQPQGRGRFPNQGTRMKQGGAK